MINPTLTALRRPRIGPVRRQRLGFRSLTLGLLTVMLGGACADDPTVPDTKDDEKDIRFGGLEVLWRIEHEGKVGEVRGFSKLATDGRRVFGDVAQVMAAFDAETGEQLWEFHRPPGGPENLVVRDGRVLYAGRTAMAIDAETGEELWRFPVNAVAGLGYSDADERAFYFGGDSTHQRFFAGSPTVAGDLLLVTLNVQNEYIALDRFTVEKRWRIEGRNPNAGLLESPEVEGQRGYTGANSREVWGFSLPSGEVLWKSQAPQGVSYLEICGSRLLGDAIGWFIVVDTESGDVLFGDVIEDPDGNQEIVQGDLATSGDLAFLSTSRARYGFRCPTR